MPKVDKLFKISVRALIREYSEQFFQTAAYYHQCLENLDHTDEKHDTPADMDGQLAAAIEGAAVAQKTLKDIEKREAGINKKIDSDEGLHTLSPKEALRKAYTETVSSQEEHIHIIVSFLITPALSKSTIPIPESAFPYRAIWEIVLEEYEKVACIQMFLAIRTQNGRKDPFEMLSYYNCIHLEEFSYAMHNIPVTIKYDASNSIKVQDTLKNILQSGFSILQQRWEEGTSDSSLYSFVSREYNAYHKSIIERVFLQSACCGYLDIMQWLERRLPNRRQLFNKAFGCALMGNQFEVLQWLWKSFDKYEDKINLLDYYYLNSFETRFGFFKQAVKQNQFEVVQWLFVQFNDSDKINLLRSRYNPFLDAAVNANLKLLQLFWEHSNLVVKEALLNNQLLPPTIGVVNYGIDAVLRYAAEKGQLDVLEWVKSLILEYRDKLYFSQILKQDKYRIFIFGSLEGKKWLAEQFPELFDEMIGMRESAAFSRSDLASKQWLLEAAPHLREKMLESQNYEAFRNGELKTMKFLWKLASPDQQKAMLVANEETVCSKYNNIFESTILYYPISYSSINKLEWLCGEALAQQPGMIKFARQILSNLCATKSTKKNNYILSEVFKAIKIGTGTNGNGFVFLLLSIPPNKLCELNLELCEKIIQEKQLLLNARILKARCDIDLEKQFSDVLDIINSVVKSIKLNSSAMSASDEKATDGTDDEHTSDSPKRDANHSDVSDLEIMEEGVGVVEQDETLLQIEETEDHQQQLEETSCRADALQRQLKEVERTNLEQNSEFNVDKPSKTINAIRGKISREPWKVGSLGCCSIFQGGVSRDVGNGNIRRIPHRVAEIFEIIDNEDINEPQKLQDIKAKAFEAITEPRWFRKESTQQFYEDINSDNFEGFKCKP